MMDDARLAYLAALEVPVWVPKQRSHVPEDKPDVERIRIGPGSGGTLMVSAKRDQSSSILASDISRVLPEAPVWAWPEFEGAGVTAAEAVEEALFTCVVVYGHALAGRLFGKEVPEHLGPAKVLVADDLEALQSHPDARRRLWRQLCTAGVVTGR